jgi:uncharacterized damage-inducible protein DinB
MTGPDAPANRSRDLLLRYLNSQRRHVLGILEGLDDEQLRASVLPSGWSPLGLVQHLTLDVEEFWFSAVVAGDRSAVAASTGRGATDAWQVGPEVSAQSVLERYRAAAGRADAVVTATALDAAPAWWPDHFGDRFLNTLEEVLLHVITETACHAGHLDAVRELLDGRRWVVLG